ncbi:acyl-CoA desaturase [Nannocystis punicea]|uniref:Fatty acid desaturase n=1 Tax=Nannocystis punicea TaxID=2995304 RepID=A0ABY7HFH4_9BACT|nr:fatty acid desaturase [Nannocystis poenicansa]WAS97951.1 fatty acid desaturase [Nannocystis poenicansa]
MSTAVEVEEFVPPPATSSPEVGGLMWSHVIGAGLMHLAVVAAPFTFSWSGLGVALVLWWLAGGVGICLGYHRLLCHRSFAVPRLLTYVIVLFGTLSWQGSPVLWVGKHRLHHRWSDQEHDPHSPRRGLLWAHMLWVFMRADEDAERAFARDLLRDPVMRWFDRWHYVPQFVLAVLLYVVGEAWFGQGWSWVVWGVPVRLVFTYHATWLVNSAAHRWGYRNYETRDDSRNNWWVALLTFGEGWHNNHHAHQRAAAHGRRWFELDPTYLMIRGLALVGLARDIVAPREPLKS